MLDWLQSLAHLIYGFTLPRAALVAENTALRQQLIVLRRRAPKHLILTRADRLLLTALYRLFPGVLNAIHILRPETVIRWHRMGFEGVMAL